MSAERRRAYLDASALVKLVVPEPETSALAAALADLPDTVTSVIGAVELRRAMVAAGATEEAAVGRANAVLERTTLVALTDEIRATAEAFPEPGLRTLDAIHLATAIALGSTLGALVAYDRRLTASALDIGLPVLAPGREP